MGPEEPLVTRQPVGFELGEVARNSFALRSDLWIGGHFSDRGFIPQSRLRSMA
jgi:hypothetical protein